MSSDLHRTSSIVGVRIKLLLRSLYYKIEVCYPKLKFYCTRVMELLFVASNFYNWYETSTHVQMLNYSYSYISLLSGYGYLAQGGDSIYRGVDYKWCCGGPN